VGPLRRATPHYVLSSTLCSALWPKTSFLGGLDEIAALKQQPGKDIYLVGVLELRLASSGSLFLLIAGRKALFATTERRRGPELLKAQQLQGRKRQGIRSAAGGT
jgi:hypothetical protein